MPRLGDTQPYGKAEEPTMKGLEDDDLVTAKGRFGRDIVTVHRLARRRWANRATHEELDQVDVDAVFQELAAKAETLRAPEEFARALRRSLCKLGDAHFEVVPDPARGQWYESGVEVEWLSGSAVLVQVDDKRFSGSRRPRVGDLVVEVDGEPVIDYVASTCRSPGSSPAHRTRQALDDLGRQFRFDEDRELPSQLQLLRSNGRRYTLELPWERTKAHNGPCIEARTLDNDTVGLMTVHTLACGTPPGGDDTFERELGEALQQVGGAQDIIVDLRHTPGGRDEQARALAARLIDAPIQWMRFRQKEGDAPWGELETNELAPADGTRLGDKPLWLLVGPGCESTCEIFAAAMTTRDRTTLVGQPTAGAVGNPEEVLLSKSGLRVTVPRTQYAVPGTDMVIEGRGVVPQIEVLTTTQDIRRGRDPVLEAVFQRK